MASTSTETVSLTARGNVCAFADGTINRDIKMKLSAAKPCRYRLFAIAEMMSGRVREGGQDRRWSLGFIGGSFIWLDYLVRLLAQGLAALSLKPLL